MKKQSKKIAFGGLISALSLVILFMTGLFPFAEYALPAIAGMLLVSIVLDFGKKTALVAYASVAAMSLLIVPNKEAALMFICFFGYYPILKSVLEARKSRILEYILKFAIFNLAIISAYLTAIYVFGMTELIEELSSGLKYGIPILLLLGNIVFFLYDQCLSGLITKYCAKLRPRLRHLL